MQQPESRQLGAVGEAAVKLAFLRIGWGVADAPHEHDVGTDLYLLVRDDRLSDSGLMMGAQVKAGASWFEEPRYDEAGNVVGWWFRENRRHADYWLAHILPHLLILHDDNQAISYWAKISAESMVSTGKGVKVFVSRANTVDSEHSETLLGAASENRNHPAENLSRRAATRQADFALANAIDLLARSSQKSPLEATPDDFRMAFAAELRTLHGSTGSPSIDFLSRKVGCDPIQIKEYLSGRHLPSRSRAVALVQAMAEHARDVSIELASQQVDIVTWERKWRLTRKPGMQKTVKNKARFRIT